MSLGTAAIHRVDVVSLRPLLKPGADQAKQKYTGSSCFLSSGLVPGVQQESGLHLSPSSFSFSLSLFSSSLPLIFFSPRLIFSFSLPPSSFEKPSAIQQRAIIPCIKGLCNSSLHWCVVSFLRHPISTPPYHPPPHTHPTPHTHTGYDVIAQAQSGTGKTATFAIAILEQIDISKLNCQALVLAPTRELAQQIQKVLELTFSSSLPSFLAPLFLPPSSFLLPFLPPVCVTTSLMSKCQLILNYPTPPSLLLPPPPHFSSSGGYSSRGLSGCTVPRLHWGYQREDRHDKTGDGTTRRGWHTGTGSRHDPEKGPWYVPGLMLLVSFPIGACNLCQYHYVVQS